MCRHTTAANTSVITAWTIRLLEGVSHAQSGKGEDWSTTSLPWTTLSRPNLNTTGHIPEAQLSFRGSESVPFVSDLQLVIRIGSEGLSR